MSGGRPHTLIPFAATPPHTAVGAGPFPLHLASFDAFASALGVPHDDGDAATPFPSLPPP